MDTMKNHPKSQLWNPNLGIRFCLKPEAKPLYPTLDFARFFHAEATETTPIQGQQSQIMLQKPKAQFSGLISSLAAGRPILSNDGAILSKARSGTSTPVQVAQPLPPPPKTQLDFNMSESSFRDALNSTAKSAGSFWSHTLYESIQPDGTNKRVKVHYCRSRHTMEHVCKKYFANEQVLGFDMEWVAYAKRDSGPRANVSLIQVASPSRIALFHVAIFPKDDFVAPAFKAIMENADISKVGVNIQADCTRLRNQLGVKTQGILELSHLYKVVKYSHDSGQQRLINKSCVSLANQVQDVLRLPLYKEPSVRSSDWSKCLSEKQLTYAAADAYAGIQLYHVLETRRLQLDPVPDRPFHAELGLPIPILELPLTVDEADASSGIEVSDSEDESVSALDAESEPAPDTSQGKQTPIIPERDARILAAEGAAWTYRTNKKTAVLARPSALRAYYIWHNNEDLQPKNIAELLRDPPLQTNTVVSYILDCLVKEKLPYDSARLTAELLNGSEYVRSKYTALLGA